MDGFKRQAVLLTLLDAMKQHGSWCGETHVQKCAYFLTEGLGVPLDLEFVLYKHGPFSFDLREVLGEMRGTFLIDVESRQPYGPSLAVTELGRNLTLRFPTTVQKYADHVELVAEKLSPRNVSDLERLSTALYVRRQRPEASTKEHASQIISLKPHIPSDKAEEAVGEVIELLAQAG